MKYLLWIDGKQNGPYESERIRELLLEGRVASVTLCHQENGVGEWCPISDFPEITNPPKPPEPITPPIESPASTTAITKPAFSLPPIETPGVASALTFFAVLDFIGGFVGGLMVGTAEYHPNPGLGLLIFVSGVLSGLILLGFAAIVENTKESAQRLRRIEVLIFKANADKYEN